MVEDVVAALPGEAGPGRGAAVGRFLVLGPLGGDPGAALSAYDPELERKVALRPIRDARAVRATARVHHPNLVAVYDVAVAGDAAYAVTEDVGGSTLPDWLADGKRPWRDILDIVVAAGDGLAAAHRVGVVHGAIDLTSVLVGGDGRPRVSGFGVAPAGADVRADQAAFAATAWEAVHGARPGPDADVPRDRRAPARIYRVLARGLAARPGDRWPSMDALVAALRRGSRVRRIAAAAAIVVAGAAAFGAGRAMFVPPACTGGEDVIGPVWDAGARARVDAAFRATGRPYAADTFARVDAALRQRAAAWMAAHHDACADTRVRHRQSDALLDVRMRCLARARVEMGALVSLFEAADVGTLDRAAQAAAEVGDIDACADVAALAAAAPPPKDPAVALEVEAQRQELARNRAVRLIGRWKDGLARSRDLVGRARRVGYAPTLAAALTAVGSSELSVGDPVAGVDMLHEAVAVAAQAGDDRMEANALTQLMFGYGSRLQQFDAADVVFHIATGAVARAGNAPLLLENLYRYRGDTLFRAGNYLASLGYRYAYLGLCEMDHGPDAAETGYAISAVAAAISHLGRGLAARAVYQRGIAIGEKALGPQHPLVAIMVNNYGANLLDNSDYDGAAAAFERVLSVQEASLGADDSLVLESLHNLGKARYLQGRLSEARALVARAIRGRLATLGPDNPKLADSYVVLGAIDHADGDFDGAHRHYLDAMAIQHKKFGEAHPSLSETYASDAQALMALGRMREARAAAERAVASDRQTIGETNPDFAETLGILADVVAAEGKPAEAIPLYRRALALGEVRDGPAGEALVEPLLGLCDAQVDTGDAAGGLVACDRAVAIAGARGEIAVRAALHRDRAAWAAGRDRAGAVADARATRARLPDAARLKREAARIDEWLARASRTK